MDKKLKRAWVKALRSGTRRQGRMLLKRRRDIGERTEYCCLGVLCAVMGAKWKGGGGPVLEGARLDENGDNGKLNRKALKLVGLRGRDQEKLIDMNDSSPMTSFKKIADYIEEKL